MNRTPARTAVANGARREAARLSQALETVDFHGWDPYDALSSPALRLVARQRFGRQAAIQLLKRSPVNLRPLLVVPRQRHTKALALCISAYAELARLPGGERYGTLAESLAGDLADRLIVENGAPVGWGYDFDVQTRWGFYPAGEPNAVVTAFSLEALRAASALPGDSSRLAELGVRVARRVQATFGIDGKPFFGYYGGSRTPIHNASVLLASAAAQWADVDTDVLGAAERAVYFTVSRQAPDGSWPYGEGRGLEWVDGYHTAYILVALERWLTTRDDSSVEAALSRGLRLYIDRLFETSGAPRATIDRCYPMDIHGASSAIWALTLLRRRSDKALPLARQVLGWTRTHMRRSDGRYGFQLHRRYRNSSSYIRWNDAHMLLALATLTTTEDSHAV
jgi:hypothetical protein